MRNIGLTLTKFLGRRKAVSVATTTKFQIPVLQYFTYRINATLIFSSYYPFIYIFTYSVMLKAEVMIPRLVGKYCIDCRCSALREEKVRYTPNVTVQDHHLRPQQSAPSLSESEAEGSERDMGQK
jgi:hypothetical protein